MRIKEAFLKRKSFFTTVLLAILCIAVIIISAARIRADRSTVDANGEKISDLYEEITSLEDEIDYYEYKMTQPKEELIEEAAREKDYIYEDETKYTNCTPGS